MDVDEHQAAEMKIELEKTLLNQERERTEQLRLQIALQQSQTQAEMQKGMMTMMGDVMKLLGKRGREEDKDGGDDGGGL